MVPLASCERRMNAEPCMFRAFMPARLKRHQYIRPVSRVAVVGPGLESSDRVRRRA